MLKTNIKLLLEIYHQLEICLKFYSSDIVHNVAHLPSYTNNRKIEDSKYNKGQPKRKEIKKRIKDNRDGKGREKHISSKNQAEYIEHNIKANER